MGDVVVHKYILIDKEYITENANTLFDLYELNEDEKTVSLFLPKNSKVSDIDKIRIRDSRPLYIPKEQREDYDDYVALHIRTIAESSQYIPYEKKAMVLYQKAAKTMEQLFEDPEALGNAEKARDLVEDMLYTIMDDAFTIDSLMAIAAHDYYTHTHSINVSIYALSFGAHLGLKDKNLEDLGQSAVMHDLGKSRVHKAIINKNGKLDESEFAEMMHHPVWGYEIAKKLGVTDERILSGIKHHHEKLDGTGYPDKLKENKISLFARIIAICDIFDALTTRRSYKDPMTSFNAIKLIKNQMQGHVDMKLLNSFILMLKKQDEDKEKHNEN